MLLRTQPRFDVALQSVAQNYKTTLIQRSTSTKFHTHSTTSFHELNIIRAFVV